MHPLPEALLTADPDMVTRVAVHLENDEPITAHAEYGDAGDPQESWSHTPDQTGSTLDFTVYLHADATSGVRVVGTDATGRAVAGPTQEFQVDSLPSAIPDFGSTIDDVTHFRICYCRKFVYRIFEFQLRKTGY